MASLSKVFCANCGLAWLAYKTMLKGNERQASRCRFDLYAGRLLAHKWSDPSGGTFADNDPEMNRAA